MALSYTITKEDFDALPEIVKAEYKESGDAYKLDVTGIDLKANDKLEGERGKRRAAEKDKKMLQDKLDELADNDDRPSLIENHAKAIKREQTKREEAEKRYNDYLTKTVRDKTVTELANKLSKTAPALLIPHLEKFVGVDTTGDTPSAVVLGTDGKPDAAMTLDKLEKNFRDNKDFGAIITASGASGGGASRATGTGGSGVPSRAGFVNDKPVSLAGMKPHELAAHLSQKAEQSKTAG